MTMNSPEEEKNTDAPEDLDAKYERLIPKNYQHK